MKAYCNESGQLLDKSAVESTEKLQLKWDRSMRLFYRQTSGITHRFARYIHRYYLSLSNPFCGPLQAGSGSAAISLGCTLHLPHLCPSYIHSEADSFKLSLNTLRMVWLETSRWQVTVLFDHFLKMSLYCSKRVLFSWCIRSSICLDMSAGITGTDFTLQSFTTWVSQKSKLEFYHGLMGYVG